MDETGGSDDTGGRKPVVSDEKILQLVVESSDPVVTAPELADELPISKTGVYKRLRDLDERGLIDSKKIGQGKAWWITTDGEAFLDGSSD